MKKSLKKLFAISAASLILSNGFAGAPEGLIIQNASTYNSYMQICNNQSCSDQKLCTSSLGAFGVTKPGTTSTILKGLVEHTCNYNINDGKGCYIELFTAPKGSINFSCQKTPDTPATEINWNIVPIMKKVTGTNITYTPSFGDTNITIKMINN